MAKKKRRGVKVYRPHGLSTILYALFGLAVVACLVGIIMLTMFSCQKEGTTTITFTGLEYLFYCFRKFIGSFVTIPAQGATFEAYLAPETTNVLLKYIQNFHEYIEWGIGGLFTLSALWAVITALLSLFMIILGKMNHPKGIKTLGWMTFWFAGIGYGLSYMYFVFIGQIDGNGLVIQPDNTSLLLLGAMFVAALFLTIIYRLGLKDRVPLIKNKRRDDDEEDEVDEVSPRQVEQEDSLNKSTSISDNKQNVITIGNSAYKKNVDIKVANIPEGVVSLGSSAFANCVNLTEVNLPSSLQEISFNCFFNTPKLTSIYYAGTVELWKTVRRGSNWLIKSGTQTVKCKNGQIKVNPSR